STKPPRTLAQVFEEYTIDLSFAKTRVVVKLFQRGERFISRSEARRVTHGLERFAEVVLDFAGIDEVGQGFCDEVFRVWAAAHRRTKFTSVNMSREVKFMVERAVRARSPR